MLLADAINNHGGYEITPFHSFHDEVDSYRNHVWQCDGPCREHAPHFGKVKRSMNRPPSKLDPWWKRHAEECGGLYTKIASPELTKEQLSRMSQRERAGRQKNKIDGWVTRKPNDKSQEEPKNRTNPANVRGAPTAPTRTERGIESFFKPR
jgi:hypothetical protein